MYKKDLKYNKNKFKTSPDAQLEDQPPKDSGMPTRDYATNPSFTRKAFKDLAFNSFTMKVDPNSEVAYQSDPYAVINRTNPIVDAYYPGTDNTSGSVIPQLANGTTSTFHDVPDSMQMELKINYLYTYLNTNSNADNYEKSSHKYGRVNDKMMIPYQEIINTISAEAYYDLPFFKWYAEGGHTYTDSLLDVLLNYQSMIQAVTSIPLRYRVIRSLEKHLKDMCYMNGAPKLNTIYGLLKKAAVINVFKGVSESIMYHYLDTYWYQQIAMLVGIPCRKSNDMLDPLMDIIPEYDINTSLQVWDDDNKSNKIIDFSNYSTFMTRINEVLRLTSPQYVLSLARNSANTTQDLVDWQNSIVNKCGDIISGMDQLTYDFADLIVAFKRMSKVGITEWKIGQFVNLDKLVEDYEPKFNKLIFDIYRSAFTGSKQIVYSANTNKWDLSDLWDKYLGIPSYDYKSGGSILAFSSKIVDRTNAPDSIVYPALFYGAGAGNGIEIDVYTRANNKYTIINDPGTITTGQVGQSIGRLSPISSYDSKEYNMPSMDMTAIVANPKDQAWLQNTMEETFGYCEALVDVDDTDPDNPVYTLNYMAIPDALCFVDIEIDDQTNAIETFVRQHSPFRVIKTSLINNLGFSTKK